jgi:hypothetical protein
MWGYLRETAEGVLGVDHPAVLDAGFGSYSQCHRIFQRTFGCTPRSFFETPLRAQTQDAFAC